MVTGVCSDIAGGSLTEAEFSLVQRHCDRTIGDLLRLRLDLCIEHDFEEFAALRSQVADGFVYPSFDPRHSRLDRDAFWLRAVDEAGRTVATHASRVFRTDDFYRLMRSERLWHDRGVHILNSGYKMNCPIPPFGGVVGHTGGMWVHPSQRGRRLATLLPSLARGLLLRNYEVEYETGLVFEELVPLALRSYGYPRVELCVDGLFPPTGEPERVYMCHMTRQEALAQIEHGLSEPLPLEVAAA
jgi:hypothetical protein